VNGINDIMYYPTLDESVKNGLGSVKEPKEAAKQVEQVFLNELLKNMLENTEFGKDKIVSDYMPYITSEISKTLSERGIGIHEFLLRSPSFRNMIGENQTINDAEDVQTGKKDLSGKELKMPVRSSIISGYGPTVLQNIK